MSVPGRPELRVVTDSTGYLPAELVAKYQILVVPLQVVVGTRVGAEGLDVLPADVASALSGRTGRVSTSRPSPQQFAAAYRAAAAAGARSVLSVHLSGGLSGTLRSAELAAADAPVGVRVVDSRSVGMGLGFAVLAAAEAAAAGASLGEAERVARRTAARGRVLFCLPTLEHLRRGGRIGAAQAWFGTALSIKPILHLCAGVIVPLEKVRTTSRAVARLETLAVDTAADRPVDVAVHHLQAAEAAEGLAGRLAGRIAGLQSLQLAEVGAVIGAHVGPGLLGVVVSPRS